MEKSKLNREIWGVIASVAAILVLMSLASYDPADRSLNAPSGNLETHNWAGIVGAYTADLLLQGLGLTAYLVPLFLLLFSYQLFSDAYPRVRFDRVAGYSFFILSGALVLSLLIDSENAREAGGIVGGFTKETILVPLFGRISAVLISFSLMLLALMLISQNSLVATLSRIGKGAGDVKKRLFPPLQKVARHLQDLKEKRAAENTKKERREFIPPPILLKEEVKVEPARKALRKSTPVPEQLRFAGIGQGYKLPAISLLDSPETEHVRIDKETLQANSLILQKKLADFGVEGEVVAVRPGPVITMYEFKPAAGVKVRRIVTLADDLSMALRAVSVRILAPIPGESVVGVEIPNPRREKVLLKQVIEGDLYQQADSKITLALGKDISGYPFVADLSRMPHVLVAGATGTGKSVSINAMILSILFKASPQDVQFIMIDPKMLELTVYEDLPHLLVPVVTDPKKASSALFWAMDEMDRRYRLMKEKGARNIDQYNRILEKESGNKRGVIDLTDPEESGEKNQTVRNPEAEAPLVHERLPRIVIVVDELADLMMSVGRDIEEYITRLAQKARAAGIHLILATQRPSVDVITGLIKANFPARISFQVTSRVESRTILDSIGAERLLGNGDMLFLPPGTARLTRVHGAFVSDQEIKKVMQFITQQAKPRYRPEVFEAKKEIESGIVEDDYDEMYDRAVEVVTETQQASISMIQRRLRVGYNRAARMIEQMERDGVVGPADGAKPREVYARKIDE